ncbi:MAG: helix-turn-helix transcriptional regulator [Rhodospirillales bacterium]
MNEGRSTDRRSGNDRRTVTAERRVGEERRSGLDRRHGIGSAANGGRSQTARAVVDRRSGGDRRSRIAADPSQERRSGWDRRAWMDRRAADGIVTPLATQIFSENSTLLLDLVTGFYDASMERSPWPPLLARLAGALGAATCAVQFHDYGSGTGRLQHSANIGPGWTRSYEDRFAAGNAFLRRDDRFSSAGAIWTGAQIVPDAELMATDFYRNWLAPQGLLHHLFGVVERQGSVVALLVFARVESAPPFGEREVTLLRLLLPAFQRGFRAGQVHTRTEDLRRVALRALDALPLGVAVLSGSGTVLAANQAARRNIDAGDALTIADGTLWVDWGWRKLRLRDLLSRLSAKPRTGDGDDVPAFSVPRGLRQKPLSMVLLPADGRDEFDDRDRPAAVLFIGDPDRPAQISPPIVTQLYGLSRAEARVVALLASGHRLDQVAETLGVTYDTVRKHLKQVFGKTGTDRQAELVRLLVTGPAGMLW